MSDHAGAESVVRPFGDLEAEVMDVVWASADPVTVRQMLDSLNTGGRTLAHTTVITICERLRDKGWLRREREGRSYRYSATTTTEQYSARLMNQVLESSSDRAGALLHFAGQLDPAEAATLRAALAALPADGDDR